MVLETPLGDTLTLRNLSETSISANDFLFVDVNGDLLPMAGDEDANLLIGGTGQDVFVFHTNNGDDIIADYEDGIDRMRFNGVTFHFGDLAISDNAANRLIATPDGNSVTLVGQAGLTLTEDDFLFA